MKLFTFLNILIIFIQEVIKVVNGKNLSGPFVEIRNLSQIKNPETYYRTVRKLQMCPGSGLAVIKASKIN